MPASHQKKLIFQGFQTSLLYVIAKDKIVSVSVKGKVVSITGTKKVPSEDITNSKLYDKLPIQDF